MPGSMHLVARVAHQRDAALDTRERLLDMLSSAGGHVVLATCHRVEMYEVAATPQDVPEMRTLLDEDAATHLFRVAAGLDSAIAGEPQILRQVRAAYESSAPQLHPLLRRAFERALHVGREIRRSSRLGEVRRSVGSLAVDAALRELDDPLAATVLVVGAGEMGKLAVRALSHRVARVLVANRDQARAAVVAAANGGEAIALDRIAGVLGHVDALISAADTRGAVLSRGLLQTRADARRLVVVDIAVPRSVAEDARGLRGLLYRSVDDLVDGGATVPQSEIASAAERCRREAARLMREWGEHEAAEAIRAVRVHADRLRRAQLERAMRRLTHLGERDRKIVEALSVGVTNSLLHSPTIALREEPSRGTVARELFGLDREGT